MGQRRTLSGLALIMIAISVFLTVLVGKPNMVSAVAFLTGFILLLSIRRVDEMRVPIPDPPPRRDAIPMVAPRESPSGRVLNPDSSERVFASMRERQRREG